MPSESFNADIPFDGLSAVQHRKARRYGTSSQEGHLNVRQ